MNKLEYAIAEGFLAIYFFMDVELNRLNASMAYSPMMGVHCEDGLNNQRYLNVMGERYPLNDEFFREYGTLLVSSKVEADRFVSHWRAERTATSILFKTELIPQLQLSE